ncbi:MAG: hypothetical protein M3Y65_20580 [Pseudomonadota bacterium]|nr:hypothetical protein [Pseudomonadota bacterium]
MKFTKLFRGVPDGCIYPVGYQPGDECPPELLQAAGEAKVLEVDGQVDAGLLAPEAAQVVEPEVLPAAIPATAKGKQK